MGRRRCRGGIGSGRAGDRDQSGLLWFADAVLSQEQPELPATDAALAGLDPAYLAAVALQYLAAVALQYLGSISKRIPQPFPVVPQRGADQPASS